MVVAAGVSRETSERLAIFKDALIKWNRALNLVSATTIGNLDTRHMDDSAQILDHAPTDLFHWLDLGAGGGLPGLVVAAHLCETRPHCQVTLVEADRRKSVFLREAARLMGVRVTVIAARIEDIAPLGACVVSARALAPLPLLCEYARRHIKQDGVALFLKGSHKQDELESARDAGWQFDLHIHKSKTNPHGVVLALRNLQNDRA